MISSKPTILILLAVAIGILSPTLIRAETRPAEYKTLSAAVEQLLSSPDAITSSAGILPAEQRKQIVNSTVLFDDQRPNQINWNVLTHNVQQGISYIVADATSSYKGLTDNLRRWVIFLPEYGVLMLDEFKTTASTCRLVFNDHTKFHFDENLLDTYLGSISITAEFSISNAGGKLQVEVSNWPSIEPVTVSQHQASDQQTWQLEVKSTLEKDYDNPQYLITWIRNASHENSSKYKGVSTMWEESKAAFHIEAKSSKLNTKLTLDFDKMTVSRTN